MKVEGWLNMILVMGVVLLMSVGSTLARNLCPANIAPCTCTVKTKGLVVNCENQNTEKIQGVMNVIKESHGTIISYLTLRMNNMPRLPDHIFMGKSLTAYRIFKRPAVLLEN